MAQAAGYEAARSAALVAHDQHFGMNNCSFSVQDQALDVTLTWPKGMEMPLTYTVDFVLPRGATTSLTFTVWLPSDFPSDREPPIQCTAANCPISTFHYQGLFMAAGEPSNVSDYGCSDPPISVWTANVRIGAQFPKDGDVEMVEGFMSNHYWLHDPFS